MSEEIISVESNLYPDAKVEHYYNVAVEVITDTYTGYQSMGWVYMDSDICKEWQEYDKTHPENYEENED